MLRFLAAFIVLFGGAVALLSLLPNPPKVMRPASAVASQLHTEAAPVETHQDVRVVYPAPGGSATAAPVVTKATLDPAPAPAAPQPAPATAVASVYPQASATADAASAGVPPVDAAAQAGTKNINLNTASIEELNSIPGAGRIGRMIASHRPYQSVEDLLRKRVIKKSVYERIKDQVAAQ